MTKIKNDVTMVQQGNRGARFNLRIDPQYESIKIFYNENDNGIPAWEGELTWDSVVRPPKPKRPLQEIEHDLVVTLSRYIDGHGGISGWKEVQNLMAEWRDSQ